MVLLDDSGLLHDADPAPGGVENLGCDPGRRFRRKPHADRGDVLRPALADLLLLHRLAARLAQRDGHAGERAGRDGVHGAAVLGELQGQHPGEPRDARLGRAVVGLTEVAVQAGHAREIEDSATGAVVLPNVAREGAGAAVVTFQVHGQHGVPVRLLHLEDGAVAQDARVVDQDVHGAERVQG